MTQIEQALALPMRRFIRPWKLAAGSMIAVAGLATLVADAGRLVA